MHDETVSICDTIKACFIALIAHQIREGNHARDERYCLAQAASLVQAAFEKISPPASVARF